MKSRFSAESINKDKNGFSIPPTAPLSAEKVAVGSSSRKCEKSSLPDAFGRTRGASTRAEVTTQSGLWLTPEISLGGPGCGLFPMVAREIWRYPEVHREIARLPMSLP